MARLRRIIMLSGNKHKVEEVRELAEGFGIEVKWTNYSKLEIQSDDLNEIAAAAGSAAYSRLRLPFILEDSGLFINALNGFPGPYSAQAYKSIGLKGVLALLRGARNRGAYFKTVMCYVDKTGRIRLFSGIVRGRIATSVHTRRGFGYDPIFLPYGESKTFSELPISEKNKLSHRGRAFEKFARYFVKT